MIKKEMIENFGIDRKTLNNWENDKEKKRYVLYKTLEALPIEYVENIKKQIKERAENEKLLDNS
jgi:DNA-binding XRE family transcriptional regulator